MTSLPAPTQTRAIVQQRDLSGDDVPHLTRVEVDLLMDAARSNGGKYGERDALLIALLFDAALRIVEVVGRSEKEAAQMTREVTARLSKRPGRPKKIHYEPRPGISMADFAHTQTGWALNVVGKGNRPAAVAVSASLVARLSLYASEARIGHTAPLFPISRSRAFQILKAAYVASGVRKPAHVGSVHVLRHAGAIDRMAQTRDPKAVQDQLRHKDSRMTLRYMKTLSRKASLATNQQVDNGW